MKLFRVTIFLGVFCLCATQLFAQTEPTGYWEECLPYSGSISVTASAEKVFSTNGFSLFSSEFSDYSYTRYSKVNLLSDVGFSNLKYDLNKKILFIAYSNSNIDLLRGTQVTNLSDIKRKNIIGDKTIYDINFQGSKVYLSCGFGIVVINVDANQIDDTWYFGPGGNSLVTYATAVIGNQIYAATENGIYSADLNNPNLANYNFWTLMSGNGLPAGKVKDVAAFNNSLYALAGDSLMQFDGMNWNLIWHEPNWVLQHMDEDADQKMMICSWSNNGITQLSKLVLVSPSNTIDSVKANNNGMWQPVQSCFANNKYYVADSYGTLLEIDGTTTVVIAPNGPYSSSLYNLKVNSNNGNAYVVCGGVDISWNYTFNDLGVYNRIGGIWQNWNHYSVPMLQGVFDFLSIAINPINQKVYYGTYSDGLFEYDDVNGFTNHWNKFNSSLEYTVGDTLRTKIAGLAFDSQNNLWISNIGAQRLISVYKADGTWQNFEPPFPMNGNFIGPIAIDQNNYKWFVLPRGNGMLVFDSGNDLGDTNDDRYIHLGTGAGNGNLPSDDVTCVTVDQNNEVWIGTKQGVGVVYCPSEIFTPGACDAQWPIVNVGGYNNYLLTTETIRAIAVDGANRKWFGTDNGLFLMSADGLTQIKYFNTENSPLFSNFILSLDIDNKTGELFIGTEKGIQIYHGDATITTIPNCTAYVFPNPVRETYAGDITITNVPNNASIKITDAAGNLVYELTANGGTAIWNGNNYNGQRVATGVYFLLISDPAGQSSCQSKMMFIH